MVTMSGILESVPLFAKYLRTIEERIGAIDVILIRVCMKRLLLRGHEKRESFLRLLNGYMSRSNFITTF